MQNNETKIFPWNDNFEVGVADIDEQHRILVDFINRICSCALNDENHYELIEALLGELVDYTRYHFKFEENYYQENRILKPLLDKHKENHAGLISQVQSLKENFDVTTEENSGLDKILTTLVLWLTNHILNDDMRMCSIASLLKNGVPEDEVEEIADKELNGAKGSISKVMISMANVSSASFKELRREITYRRKLESQLKDEISVRKEAEEKLKYLALHDALTGLPNRYLFEELCDAALRLAQRNKLEQAILFVDIDGFKKINDTLGHNAGDELLVLIGERLEKCVRNSDVVARIGGDEFVAHLAGTCSEQNAKLVASKMVKTISTPFELAAGVANVGASVGIALFPDNGDSAETLLKKSDEAMYVAKKTGKNTFKSYSEL